MSSPLWFSRNPLCWMSVLGPLLVIAGFLGYGFLSILLTSSALILSTLIFTLSKHKPGLAEIPAEDEILGHDQEISADHIESDAQVPENESQTTKKEAHEDEGSGQVDDCLAGSPPAFLSESECLGHSSTSEEDSEADWPFHDNMSHRRGCSDGSISDEDSLIEIALPSGHYLDHNKKEEEEEEESKFNQQKKMPDFATGTLLEHQCGLIELLAELNEMNEEENLIEIDISMGSIKCPRFEIEA